jgi:hypothetical protein
MRGRNGEERIILVVDEVVASRNIEAPAPPMSKTTNSAASIARI